MSRWITGVKIVTPGKPEEPGSIAVGDDGRLLEIGERSGGDILFDGGGELFAMPGFIDIHTHGANGYDLSNASLEAVNTIAEAKIKEGVTTFLPTTWTASGEELEEMAAAAAAYRSSETFARAPFLHVEGPYLNPEQAGAQNPEEMRLPDAAEIKRLHEICPVGLVSIAVELEGAIDFIGELGGMGIVTSAAHSAATYDEFLKAREAGLTHLTHYCNQMSRLHHREVGLVGAALLDDAIGIELIADTIHLCEDMLKIVFKHRSCDQIMLITDSIAASHLGDGEYPLGDSQIFVKDGVARIDAGNLAGSTLQFHQGLANVARISGLPLSELIKTCSFNQAKSLGLSDRGALEPGLLADIVLMDSDFQVAAVFKGGDLVFAAP